MDKLTWLFELQDRMSGPASKMERSISRLGNAMQEGKADKFAASLKTVEGSAKKAGDATRKLADEGFSFGQFATGLAAAGTIAAGLAVAGGKWMLDGLRFKEDTSAGFEAMLGSKDAADRVFKMATKFAAITPFKTSEVVGMANSLLTRGFKENELETLMKGVGDVGAMLGTDKMQSVIGALGKMRASGQVTGETMQMLADAGVNSKLVYASLATQLGKTEEQVKQMMSAGKIKDAEGIKAAMDAIAKGLSGGELGGAMDAKSKTLSGLLSTLESAPEDILFALGDKLAPMVDPIKGIIKKGIELLGPEAAGGKAIGAVFEKMGGVIGKVAERIGQIDFEKWIGKLGTIAGKAWPLVEKLFAGFGKAFGLSDAGASLETILDKIIDRLNGIDPATIEKLGVFAGYAAFAVMKLFEWSIRLAIGLGEVADKFIAFWVGAVDFSNDVVNDISTTFDMLPEKLMQVGLNMVQGLMQGMTTGIPGVNTVVDSLGDGLIDQMKAKLGIASPSTVFAELGVFTGQGFMQGLAASGMNQAIANPITPQQVAAGTAAGAAGGPTVSIAQVAITIGGDVKDAATAREHGKAAASSFGSQLISMLQGTASEAGG